MGPGEHVLDGDCWCEPVVVVVEPDAKWRSGGGLFHRQFLWRHELKTLPRRLWCGIVGHEVLKEHDDGSAFYFCGRCHRELRDAAA